MKFSILIPHFKTGKMTAYCISQILKHKGKHDVEIIVIDNSNDGSEKLFLTTNSDGTPNTECVNYGEHPNSDMYYLPYPKDLLQSHGIAFDFALQEIPTISEYFITLESDSFPIDDSWLDYYENLINEGYDMAGSYLRLSGGQYIHPAGAMYKLQNWLDAKELVKMYNENYDFYPNMIIQDGHPNHIMVKANSPMPKGEYHHSYRESEMTEANLLRHKPIANSVFHQAMGFNQESFHTYGKRNAETETKTILFNHSAPDVIHRLGYEPGQWFGYWHLATGKKVYQIPTEVVWMKHRENQQQEYTLTSSGVKHLWGVTAYNGVDIEELNDIVKRKQTLMDELYESIQH